MKPVDLFVRSKRGQAYALEATVAALLISVGILFILPSIAVPITDASVSDSQLENDVSNDVTQMLDMHRENGHLKSLILNYRVSDEWLEEHPYNEDGTEYEVGPEEEPEALPATGDLDGHYLLPPGPVGKSIEDIRNEHDVWVEIYLRPAGIDSDVDRVLFVEDDVSENVLTRETTTIMLYNDDKLQSPPESHTRTDSTKLQTEGNGPTLDEISGFGYKFGPNEEISGSNIYNTVTVEVVVYKSEER